MWFDHDSHDSIEEFISALPLADLLDSAEDLVYADNALMDRDFDSQHVREMVGQRGLSYVVPKRVQTSEKAQQHDCLSAAKTIGPKLILEPTSGTKRRRSTAGTITSNTTVTDGSRCLSRPPAVPFSPWTVLGGKSRAATGPLCSQLPQEARS